MIKNVIDKLATNYSLISITKQVLHTDIEDFFRSLGNYNW